MYIQSDIGKLARYSENAIEAFRIAVDNGQARLAMQILVDIIDKYADKFDEYDALLDEKFNSVKPEKLETAKEEPTKAEVPKESTENTVSTQAKAKPVQKEVQTDK